MSEFYIEANSFAAPFFSDSSHGYVEAATVKDALEKFAADYKHSCGLYAAVAYTSADARNKGEKPLGRWLCNHEIEKMRLTKDKGSYTYRGDGPGRFEIDHEPHVVDNPRAGRVVESKDD
jgi:hypothetical protein